MRAGSMKRVAACVPALLAFASVAFLPTAAQAACASETFVSCKVKGGKQLEVCILPGDFSGKGSFTYSFGPPGSPEISLSVPMSAGTVTPWSGFSRSIWASVAFPNADVTYEVWHSFDRLEADSVLEAGVNVLRGDKTIADLSCIGGEIAPAFTLEDSMAAAGYCWNRDSFEWQRSDCG